MNTYPTKVLALPVSGGASLVRSMLKNADADTNVAIITTESIAENDCMSDGWVS
jgi:hypothetical protein